MGVCSTICTIVSGTICTYPFIYFAPIQTTVVYGYYVYIPILRYGITVKIMAEEITTLQVFPATRDRLKSLAQKDETYDDFLNRMADCFENSKASRPSERKR